MRPTATRGAGHFHPVTIVTAILGVMLLAAAIVSEAVFHVSIDPTSQVLTVTLHNDTSRVVIVKQCASTCFSFDERDQLLPAASVPVNASTDNVTNWWVVSDATGKILGCLPLHFSHKIDRLMVNVSDHTTCPSGPIPGSSVATSITGFAVFLLAAGIGIAGVIFTTITAYQWASAHGLSGITAMAITLLAALVACLGGWLLFDLYVVLRQGATLARRFVAPT